MIKVMICDDLPEICEMFKREIDSQNDMQVVCTANSTNTAVSLAMEYQPDVILMDIQMDESDSGIIATQRIMECLPNTKVIILTIYNNDDIITDAYLAGAVDYLMKDSQKEKVCDSIRKVYGNDEFLGRVIAKVVRERVYKTQKQETSIIYLINHLFNLTPTEMDIVKELYQKKSRKIIAKERCMSEETVKVHIRHILRKLNFSSSAEMVNALKKMEIMQYFINR